MSPGIGLYEFTITNKTNIVAASTKPIIQANFFCGAPKYSGTWFRTIHCPGIRVGA